MKIKEINIGHYKDVCDLVEKGHSIDKACKKLNIDRLYLYKFMDEKQKIFLKNIKISNSAQGNGGWINPSIEEDLNF